MRFVFSLALGWSLATSCQCDPSRGIPTGEALMPVATPEPPSVADLLEIIYQYYPRWDPGKESVSDYLDRYDDTLEIRMLWDHVWRTHDDNAAWNAFYDAVEAALPDRWVGHAVPPLVSTPSFQIVIALESSPAVSKHMVFRISHLAPVYDYYESYRDSDGERIALHLMPTPEAAPIAALVEPLIAKYFGYHRLDPDVGKSVVLGIAVEDRSPGEATVADALFDYNRNW